MAGWRDRGRIGVEKARPRLRGRRPEVRTLARRSAASEQTSGIARVASAVARLDQVKQQNAAPVDESAAAAQSLKRQAARLVEAVAVFQLA
jgi:methyl-accepting chemotaxis protein